MININECTNFDYFILAIIAISSLFGLFRGFLYSVIYFFGWVLSAIIVIVFYPSLFDFLKSHIASVNLAKLAASLGFYILVLILVTIINSRLLAMTSIIRGGIFDRIFGLAFGAIRGIIICCIIFFFTLTSITAVSVSEKPKWLTKAQTYPYLDKCTKIGISTFSNEFDEKYLLQIFNSDSLSKMIDKHKEEIPETIEEELRQYEDNILKNDDNKNDEKHHN